MNAFYDGVNGFLIIAIFNVRNLAVKNCGMVIIGCIPEYFVCGIWVFYFVEMKVLEKLANFIIRKFSGIT